MALELFEHPLSPYARKLELVIYEKGIPVQRVFVNPNARSDDPSFQEFVLASPQLEAINWGLMELHYFKRAEAKQAAEMTARAGEQLEGRELAEDTIRFAREFE